MLSYGFNGKEKDDEINGNGNEYDFGNRIYDSRLGRWLSIDKRYRDYPEMSPYNFVRNNPLIYIDPDGNGVEPVITKYSFSQDPVTGDRVINVEYTLTIDIKVINMSKAVMNSPTDISRFGYNVGQQVADSYSGQGEYQLGKTVSTFTGGEFNYAQNTKLITTLKVNVNVTEINSLDDARIKPGDNIVAIVDKVIPNADGAPAVGKTQLGGNCAVVQAAYNQDGSVDLETMVQTTIHEIGHWLFLKDEYITKNGKTTYDGGDNAMGTSGLKVTSGQRGDISLMVLGRYSNLKMGLGVDPAKKNVGFDPNIKKNAKTFIKTHSFTTKKVE